MKIEKLRNWQKSFQMFLEKNNNRIINLYGYPFGKSTMAWIDKDKEDRIYYHDIRNNESISFVDLYPIYPNLEKGLTIIIITVSKLMDKKLENIEYFEVKQGDDT